MLMAANVGPKAMRRSGEYGDGPTTAPETWKKHKAQFEEGAKSAGKDPRQMPVPVEQFVVVGNKNDAKAAARLWQFIRNAFKTYFNVRDPQSIQQRAGEELPLDQVYAKWPVSTDSHGQVKAVLDLFASGATIVNIHSGQANQQNVINFYGEQVIPRVRRQLKQV
jgi:F420-dependent hydroxymycolic acid dehydrogenase